MRKVLCAALLVAVAALGAVCAKKADVEADTQAIKALLDEWANRIETQDVEWFISNYYAGDTRRLPPNQPPVEGPAAIRTSLKSTFEQGTYDEGKFFVHDVKVAGNLAAARGYSEAIFTPKAGARATPVGGKWAAVYIRQADGSWRCSYDIWNSDEPAPGTTEGGVEEKALWQIEQEFFDAFNKSDSAALERILAKEWTYLFEGQITTRPQLMADIKKGAYKVESTQINDFKAHVVGDAAIVTTTITMKGTYKGADISGTQRSIDIFIKQDGRWQVIRTQNTVINPQEP